MSAPAFSLTGPWPRLSDELPLCDPRECACCGAGDQLGVWQEHDTGDRPEHIFVVLCQRCSDAIIEKHPRLYRQLVANEPAPGVMPICLNCQHRAGSRCWSPQGRLRGGPGLKLDYPAPFQGFVRHSRDSKGRRCTRFVTFPGVVFNCSGKELALAS